MSNDLIYTVLAYKPNSVDSYRSIDRHRFDSDFAFHVSVSKEDTIAFMVLYQSYETRYGESKYEITLLINSQEYDDLYDDIKSEMWREVHNRSKKIIDDRKQAKEIQNQKDIAQAKDNIKWQELMALAKLKAKYPDAT